MRISARVSRYAILCASTTLVAPASADVIEITPSDDLIASIGALQPGDELVLAGGTYDISAKLTISVSGTAQAPIVIRAKDGEVPIVTRPNANQNTINIENNAHVTLRGLEVVGGSHGIRIFDADFITIEDCHIHDTGDVAVSANVSGSTYEGLKILRNHIHDTNNTGEGMYLGCNDNGCQMFDSLIEGNYVHHTNGSSVVQGDGIEIKEGSHDNIVRDNVIHDTNYPCILTYSVVGNGGPNIIERNLMWGCGDHGIQSAADAVIRNNIILGASADAIRNQPHQAGDPANLVIVHNTLIKASGDAIRSDGIVGSVVIGNNAIYAPNGSAIRVGGSLGALVVAGNAGVGSLQGVSMGFDNGGDIANDFVDASYTGGVPVDVFPAASGSLLVAGGDGAHVVSDDFNGTSRNGAADIGAYKADANGNPGWALAEDFKDLAPTTGGTGGAGATSSSVTSAGVGGMSASSTGGGAGATSSAGGSVVTTTSGAGATPEEDAGCGCTSPGRSPRSAGWIGLALALLGLGARRRANG